MSDLLDIDQSVFDGVGGQSLTSQRSALETAIDKNPDAYAKTLMLSDKTGIPAETVERNQAEVARRARLKDIDVNSLFEQAPEAKKWASDPDNMALVSDDFSIFGRVKKTLGDVPEAFSRSSDMMSLIRLRDLEIQGKATPEDIAMADHLSEGMEKRLGTGGVISDMVTGAATSSLPSANVGLEGAKIGLETGLAFAGTALAAGQAGPQAGIPEEVITAPVAARMGFKLGFGVGSVKESFRQMRALSYDGIVMMKDENGNRIDKETARGAANIVGLVSAPLESLGFSKILKTVPGGEALLSKLTKDGVRDLLTNSTMRKALRELGAKYGEAVLTEGTTEGLQQLAQDLGNEYAKAVANSNGSNFEHATVGEIAQDVGYSALIGGGVGGIYSTPGTLIGVHGARKRYTRPEDVAQQVQALNAEIRSMPLMQRSPERAHRLFQDIAGDEKYYIDPDIAGEVIYALPEQQRQALFSAVPDLEVELANSQTTGADIPIKKADYAAFIAPYQQSDALVEHLKLDPADMSLSERKTYIEFMAQNPEAAQILRQSLNEQPQITTIEAQKSIERTVRKALVDAGRSNTEARVLAPLFARTFSRQAAAVGADPLTFFNNSLQFQTVDENGNVVQSSGNVENILSDIDRVRSGKTGSMDAGTRQAVEEFSQRLDALGVSTDQARSMGAKALIDLVYPKDQTQNGQRLDQNPIDQLDLPLDVKEVAQDIADGIDALNGETEQVDNGQVIRDNYLSPETETINVDGVERSTKNSEGNLIADTPEKIRAFWRWFGDSKVVDDNGKPLVMYHGSNAEFEAFDTKKMGSNGSAEGYGFYFTDDKDTASGYQGKDGGSLLEVYLSIQKPLDVKQKNFSIKDTKSIIKKMVESEISEYPDEIPDYKDSFLSNIVDTYSISFDQAVNETAKLIQEGNEQAVDQIAELANISGSKERAFAAVREVTGYDGIKADGYSGEGLGGGNIFVAWFPEQIKSVNNRGTFDPNDARILYQELYESVDDLENRLKEKYGIKLSISGGKTISINKIEVPENARRQGIAKSVLQEITDWADMSGKTLTLSPTDEYGIKKSVLKKFYERNGFVSNSGKNKDFSISDTMYRNPISKLSQDARGWIDFENGLKKVVVTFTNRADFSTGMHEFSHFATATHRMFAQIARERIAAGDTSSEAQRVVDDWEKLKNKVGATSDTFTVEQEEQVASMFELYMREGNAPSDELRNVFSRYRDWLLAIYSDMRRFMGIDLDDETRSVFDNWLASQDEIDKIKDKNTSMTLTAKALGLDENIIEKISSYLNSALYVAEEKLFKDFRKEQKKKETLEYKQKYDAAFKSSKEELLKKRQYRMVNDLDENGIKIYVGNQSADRLGLPDTVQYDDYENSVPASQEDIEMMSREGDDFEARKQAVINVLLARKPKEPKGLFAFLRSKGGIKDESGELKQRDLTKQYPGLVNNKGGMALDQALIAAREAGYFQKNDGPNPDTLSINDLLDAIDQEASGMKRYADADMQKANEYHDFMRAFDQADQYANEMGIDIEKERLKRKKFGRYGYLVTTDENTQGATHSDIVAENFGYRSGEEMLAELKVTKDIDLEAGRMANDKMQKEYPELRKNRKLSDVAINALQNDKTLLALDTMINEIGKKMNKNRVNMRQFARVIAQQQIIKMKLTDSGYVFRWDVARDKEMRNALQFARSGEAEKSMLSLQKAMVNHMLFRQLTAFNDQKEKAFDLFKKVNSRDKDLAGANDIDFVGAARGILSKFGMSRENFDIAKWLDEINELDPSIRQDLVGMSNMVRVPAKKAEELTVGEFMDIYDAVKNIMWVARSIKKIEVKGKEIEREKIISDLKEQMSSLPQHRRTTLTQSSSDKLRSWVMSAKSSMRRVEQWVDAMDGGYGGVTRSYIWEPISKADNEYKEQRPMWFKKLNEILQENKKYLEQDGKIDARELAGEKFGGVFKDRMEMIGWLLHTGNESNLEKLLDGYGISVSNFENFKKRAYEQGIITDKDMAIVQKLWDFAEELKPLSQKAHKKLYGYRFDEIEPSPIDTPFGMYRGGYWPAIVDYTLVEDADIRQAQDQANGIGNSYMIPATGRGFTMKRVDGYRRPLSTDLRLATSHIDKVLRFSIIEPAIRDVSRTVNNREYREALQSVDEFAGRNMLNPWLQRVARQEVEMPLPSHAKTITAASRFFRASASAQTMMLNLSNAIQNVTGFSVSIYKVGPANWAKANIRYSMNPWAANQEVRSLSQEMRVRQNIDDDALYNAVNDIVLRRNKLSKAKNWAVKHGYIFQRLIQNYVDNVTWMAAFDQHTQAGYNEVDAISYADSVVRVTQGSTSAKDISSIEAGSAPAKLFLMFYSYFNNISNLVGTEATNIIRKSGWKGAPQLFYMYMMIGAIPFFTAEFMVKALRDDLPDDEDGDGLLDEYLSWFALSNARGVMASVPYFGQAGNALLNRHNDQPMDDRISISPVVSMGETAVRFLDQTLFDDGYNDESRMVRDALTTFGFMTGLPLGQIGKPAGYLADIHEGDSDPDNIIDFARGVVAGPPPQR